MISFWLGAPVFSAFRLEQALQQALSDTGVQPTAVLSLTARALFVVKSSEVLADASLKRIGEILSAQSLTDPLHGVEATGEHWWRLPRAGTRSPWSSKATDILQNCTVEGVEFIEQAVQFSLHGGSEVPDAVIEQLCTSLKLRTTDRMTQTIVHSVSDLPAFFEQQHLPRTLTLIPVLSQGRAALEQANQSLGLALSSDELEYLHEAYASLERDPTDAELMMFAQANSEHCRHKIFNASWVVDQEPQPMSLFDMIRHTYRSRSDGVLSAYKDNAAVLQGANAERFFPDPQTRVYAFNSEPVHTLFKVETHNHPTAIAPFPGAATGAGGEIRDEGATGRGAKPKAGLVGFTVSNLNIPDAPQPWESSPGRPDRMASPLDIMLEGPIGSASFNNEFGRPNLLGYFRTYELPSPVEGDQRYRGYHKPIMIAGGIGNIREDHIEKNPLKPGAHLVVLGGPAMLIGLGGGAASSVQSGGLDAELDFASVQRENPEMERRAQEVIDACWALGDKNPIAFIHDVGAGGLSNALPELVKDAGVGGRFDLRAIPSIDPTLSPMEIWCNEAQERYVIGIEPEQYSVFEQLCLRERCPYATVGYAVSEPVVEVRDSQQGQNPIDLPQSVLFGKPPKMERQFDTLKQQLPALDFKDVSVKDALSRVLRLPAVADKTFLITIGDRSITGMVVRDQMVGRWQVPVADCAVTALGLNTFKGEAMAMGERSPLAVINSAASARMAVGEALTNIFSADVPDLKAINLSANWMAACGEKGEDQALFEAVKAVGTALCPELGLTIPVGKDSLSMRTQWTDEQGNDQKVVSPMSLIISACARVDDVRKGLTPESSLPQASLLLVDLSGNQQRLGGSALAQVYAQVGDQTPDFEHPKLFKAFVSWLNKAREANLIDAYHDRSDGGLIVSALEIGFASRCSVTLNVPDEDSTLLPWLFNEELGVVLAVEPSGVPKLRQLADQAQLPADALIEVGSLSQAEGAPEFSVQHKGGVRFESPLLDLQSIWSETSYRMQSLRDNPDCARQAYDAVTDPSNTGLFARTTIHTPQPDSAPKTAGVVLSRPRLAVLREQGVNGHVEMAAAFTQAGFEAVDVHMSDLLADTVQLKDFQALVACGGFSYGDVLGAGSGWAKSILFHTRLRDAFAAFFDRPDTLALGVCNGCQMLSQLKELIPGAQHWPLFQRNESEQFEARLVMTEIMPSSSILLSGMTGSILPVAVAHGEGRVQAPEADLNQLLSQEQQCLRYVDAAGKPTQNYPANPNGSPGGLTGVCSQSGRVTIMMPHPERVYRTTQLSWAPKEWQEEYSPWFNLFVNARKQFN